MKYVNKPVPKTDAMSLVTGKPVYTDDLAPSDCLIVKILRSPHANAWVEEIKTDAANKIEGIACVLTYEDVSHKRFTLAGQTAPEISPWDRYIIDKHVRFVGDPVAIVAGETEEVVDKALKRIKVKYRVFQSLPVDGIVIVTSPQELVQMIVKKAFNMANMMHIPVLGVVENFSYLKCPDCGKHISLFGESHIDEAAASLGTKVLGKLPLDPAFAQKADAGEFYQMENNYLDEAVNVLKNI